MKTQNSIREAAVCQNQFDTHIALSQNDEKQVIALVEAERDQRIIRLLNVDYETNQVFAGMDRRLIAIVDEVVGTLDQRIARVIKGKDKMIQPSFVAAIRKVRTGNFKDLKLLQLIDMEDSSTRKDPLKGFASLSDPLAMFNQALARLQRVPGVR